LNTGVLRVIIIVLSVDLYGSLGGSAGMFKKIKSVKSYDKAIQKPVIRCSICNGEQIAGIKDLTTGKFEEVMVINSDKDLREFMDMYGITEITEITKEY
jgi:hypothetical protein